MVAAGLARWVLRRDNGTPERRAYSHVPSPDILSRLSKTRGAMSVMSEWMRKFPRVAVLLLGLVSVLVVPARLLAQQATRQGGGEASLVLPDLSLVDVGGFHSRALLMIGLGVAALGIVFGLVILNQLKNLPVHRSMREISELIYETCKTYLLTQGKFIAILEIFIAIVIV